MAAGPTLYILVSQKSAGHAQYQFGPDADMSLIALRVTMNVAGAGATRTIYVTHSAQNGDILYDQYVAVAVPTGGTGRFSLAPEANPCDAFTAGTVTAVTDTFPMLVFAENDYLDVYAVDATSGATVTDSPLTSVRLLVADTAAFRLGAYEPVYLPVPIIAGGLSADGAAGGQVGALSRLGCGAASTSQAKWCEVVIASQNVPSQRFPYTLLSWSTLTVSDPAYFEKSPAVADGLRILQKGLYRIELTIREIYNNALGSHNNASPRQVYPLYSQGLGYVGRFWDGVVTVGPTAEYAADNSFEGQPVPAGFDPFNDPFLLAEWSTRYTTMFRIDGALVFPPVDLQIAYRQLSPATQTVSAASRAAVVFFPSDVDDNPAGYGTVYTYP